jgi:hypothetical protein
LSFLAAPCRRRSGRALCLLDPSSQIVQGFPRVAVRHQPNARAQLA